MVVALGLGIALNLTAQGFEGLAIELDPNVRPEAVHVHYQLMGGLGGYGDFTDRTRPSSALPAGAQSSSLRVS